MTPLSRSLLITALTAGLWLGLSAATAATPPDRNVAYDAPSLRPGPPDWPVALQRLGVVTSWDRRRWVPSFVWASQTHQGRFDPSRGGPESAGRHYLAAYAPLYGLDDAAVRRAQVRRVQDVGRGGVLVVFGQRVAGVDVLRSRLTLLLDRRLGLVALGGNLHHGVSDPRLDGAWITADSEGLAVVRAAFDLRGAPPLSLRGVATAHGWQHYALDRGGTAAVHARARPIWFPLPRRLRPAFQIELRVQAQDGDVLHHSYVVDAVTGAVLQRRSLTAHAPHTYRVWADTAAPYAPHDAPKLDYTPHPAGAPDLSEPADQAGALVVLDGLNSNPDGQPDPWLAADATQTLGNNVDAYIDRVWPTDFGGAPDERAPLSATATFDYVWDPASEPLQTDDQRRAAVVQIFYTVNWLHDYFYDSGFDEAAGNAQRDNYGRGGAEGDPLLARVEGKHTGLRNNGSMSTPADGESPTMRMGLWDADDPARVHALSAMWEAGTARFGATAYDVTAEVVLVQDATAPLADGCETVQNATALAGRIAFFERGSCPYVTQVRRAQDAGAVAALVMQTEPGADHGSMGTAGATDISDITLPAMILSTTHGEALRAALAVGPETARLVVATTGVQGALDNTVVAHEWGHYIHHRLQHCSTHQCRALSEGWADFLALLALGRAGDDPDGSYAVGGYSQSFLSYAWYYGVRRVAYSADPDKNNLSFRHIADGEPLPTDIPLRSLPTENSEVHNAGEIWGAMLWEAWVALWGRSLGPSPALTWTAARRRMADYLVQSMVLAPADPTYTEQRDGVLAAALAADPDDFSLLAEAFARRGAGTCAASPSRDSTTLQGVQEDFAVSPGLRILSVTLDDAVISCDGDGLLDGQEVGHVVVQVQNTGTSTLSGAVMVVDASAPELRFPAGRETTLPDLAPFETGTATVLATLDAEANALLHVPVRVTVSHAAACEPEVSHDSVQRLNVDDFPSNSATDDVESEQPVWDVWGGDAGDPVWLRVAAADDPYNHRWHGRNVTYPSDSQLVSPSLQVSPSRDLVIRFAHRHQFDADSDRTDGGLLELSGDNGASWQDVADFVDPSYNGTLEGDGNGLAGRSGFVRQNAAWPDLEEVTLNLGRALAGQTVRLRFRIATGDEGGAHGWEVDDIGFEGLTNTPFRRLIPDELSCDPPVADAGPDQEAAPGQAVVLDGSASRDPQGAPLQFTWTQLSGPPVTLTDGDTPHPELTAPALNDATALLTFELRVESTSGQATDEVRVVVSRRASRGGCHCQGAGPGAGGLWLLLLLGLLGARRRRRP